MLKSDLRGIETEYILQGVTMSITAALKSDLRGIETKPRRCQQRTYKKLKSDLRGIETYLTSIMYLVVKLVKIRP